MKCIIFDLDGTLTCSGEGIMKSAVVTFEHLGLTPPDEAELLTFVGPPLRDSFLNHGIDKEHILRLVPPLIISKEEIDQFLAVLEQCI